MIRVLKSELGQQPLDDVLKMPLEEVHDVERVRVTFDLPLSEQVVQSYFGVRIALTGFDRDGSIPGAREVSSSFAGGDGVLQSDVLIRGVRLWLSADPEAFTVSGRLADEKDATLEWGGGAWRAIALMLKSYDLTCDIGHQFRVLEEPLERVAWIRQPSAVKRQGHDIDVSDHVKTVSQRFTPNSTHARLFAIGDAFIGLGASSPTFPLDRPVIIPRGIPIGLVASARDHQSPDELQALLTCNGPRVIRAGHLWIHASFAGCEIKHDDIERVIEMSETIGVDVARRPSLQRALERKKGL